MEYALFKVPIVGELDLFATILSGQFYERSKKYVEGRTLIYKEISPRQITGNDTIIEEIKAQAKQAIDGIQNTLDEFRKSADLFNENELKKFISTTIQRERDRRNAQFNSEIKLNPFA